MRLFAIATAAAVLSTNLSVAASENRSVLWKDVGSWSIRVVDAPNSFCEASAYWPGGTQVVLGFASGKQNPRMVVSNPDWTSVHSGDFDLIVQFGGQMPWRVPSQNISKSERVDLRIEARDLSFFEEMMGAQNFGIRFGEESVEQLEMDAAFDALVELGACQLNVAGTKATTSRDAS